MRLAISNIAWDTNEDGAVAALLQRLGIDAIDVAPGKYFSDPANTTNEDIDRVRIWWSRQGIEITGMQALLFGTTGLNLFGPTAVQEAMQQHLAHICRIGARLGATRLVFGSPKNRDRAGLNDKQAIDVAISFFRRLGDIAQSYSVVMCLEPNPPCYGSNFMTTSAETAHMVRQVSHPAIRMQLDTGSIFINGEDPFAVLQDSAPLIGHIHASEPNLVPLGGGQTNHAQIAKLVDMMLPQHIVTVEMAAVKNEPSIDRIGIALEYAISNYRPAADSKATVQDGDRK